MLPQWPWVVWATTLQFPSNGEAIADGVEKKLAEAAARAMAEIRLPTMGVLFPEANCSATIGGWISEQRKKKDKLRSDRRQRLEALPGWVWKAEK